MKFIGEKIVRGQHLGENTFKRINLFDGDYTTGFKIVEFRVVTQNVKTALQDVVGKLVTIDDDVASLKDGAIWNWSDPREVAWASSEMRVAFSPAFFTATVDESAVIIEDLFFTYGTVDTDDDPCNYYVKLHKYSLEPFVGTANIVKNMSYGG